MKIEIEGLQALATKLGVTVEHLWAVLIKQALVSAVTGLVFSALVLMVCFVVFYKRKTIQTLWEDGEEGTVALFIASVTILTALIIAAIVIIFSNVIPALANPEYWALEQVLSYLRRK